MRIVFWILAASALVACENVDDFEVTIVSPAEVLAPYSPERPGQLLLDFGSSAEALGSGNPESTLRLAILCGPDSSVERVVYHYEGSHGCASEQHYLAWIAPLAESERDSIKCGVQPGSSNTDVARGRVKSLPWPADAGVAPFAPATMPSARAITREGVRAADPGCADGHGTFTMPLTAPSP